MRIEDAQGADVPRPREFWTATAVFAALTAVFAYPLSARAGSVVLGDVPDVHLFLWTLGWIAHALIHQPLTLFDANIFHPLQHTLAFSENLIGSGLIAAPIIWVTGNHVLALNAVSLLSVVLCGSGAYFLARRVGLSVGSAFICGLIFAFSPARFFRIGQVHLTTVQWIPFALAYLHTYFRRGRARDLKIAAAFMALQAITTGHGAVFVAVAAAIVLLVRVSTRPRLSPLRVVRDLGISGALVLAPAVLVAVPYQIVQREMGFRRFLENWTVAGVSYIASPTWLHQAIVNVFVPVSYVNETAHANLFPGFLPILLAIVALAAAASGRTLGETRRTAVCYGLIAVISALLISGPPLGLWPLVYWLPGFNFIRVPSRFVILLVLALAVLSGVAFEWLRRALPPTWRRWSVALLWILLLAEFATGPLPVTPFKVQAPGGDRWLDDQQKPFAVAELPNSGMPREQTTYMLHSMAHWQRTVHGYSGFEPPQHTALYRAMRTFPDAHCLEQLRAFGVTYVVVHVDRYPPDQWPAIESQLSGVTAMDLVYQDQRSRVYRLKGN